MNVGGFTIWYPFYLVQDGSKGYFSNTQSSASQCVVNQLGISVKFCSDVELVVDELYNETEFASDRTNRMSAVEYGT